MLKYPLALFCVIVNVISFAQDTIPHMEGRISFSVRSGSFDCDLTLSNMPGISNYVFRLNSGMNINFIRNGEAGMKPLMYTKSNDDTLSSGESSAYFLKGYNQSGKYLPHSVRFKYVGKYPVVEDTTGFVDWRGNIAFNGKTVRADGLQSAWCPMIYDLDKDIRYEKMTYNLELSCTDCSTIYMNGSKPLTGQSGKFVSKNAQDLTMFAGDFKADSIAGNYYLNSDANTEQLAELDKVLKSFQSYYEKKLSIKYKGNPVYIQTTPVSVRNSWLFASYPTIVNVGWNSGFSAIENKNSSSSFQPYMAHELAHYYFGTYRSFNTEFGDLITEGFAEYLSMKATSFLTGGDSLYKQKLQSKASALRRFKAVPFSRLRSKSDYGDRELYSYYYSPLIFASVEQVIGEDRMWQLASKLLQNPGQRTDYVFFENALSSVLANKEQLNILRTKYLTADNAIENGIVALGLQSAANQSPSNTDTAQTYYYFYFSGPMLDAGSSENRVIKHTEILKITCSPEELSKISQAYHAKRFNACENSGGCSGDFNTYHTLEQAQRGMQSWFKRYGNIDRFTVKKFE